jgi:hypothetical protein
MLAFLFAALGSFVFWIIYAAVSLFISGVLIKYIAPNTYRFITTGKTEWEHDNPMSNWSSPRDSYGKTKIARYIAQQKSAYVQITIWNLFFWPVILSAFAIYGFFWVVCVIFFAKMVWPGICKGIKLFTNGLPNIKVSK